MKRQAIAATATTAICALGAVTPTALPWLTAQHTAPVDTVAEASALPQTGQAAGSSRNQARTVLRLADGTRVGQALFTARGPHATQVDVTLRLPEDVAAAGGSFHGFHVHANDVPANGNGCVADPEAPPSTWFLSADEHYSDPGETHYDHRGDMPVVYLQEDGRSLASFVTDRFLPSDIVGRTVIVHAQPDNYGNIPLGTAPTAYTPNSATATALTARTGNAGDRVVCGVVRR